MRSEVTLSTVLMLGLLAPSGCMQEGHSAKVGEHSSESGESHGSGPSEHHGDSGEEGHEHKIIVTSPIKKEVVTTQRYVSQIHSCQHIELRALEGGYLQKICVKEGQAVKKGDLLFKILPTLHQARLDSEIAEANRIEIELKNLKTLLQKQFISDQAIALKEAELAKAKAKVALAKAELGFTKVTAPFNGIVDRQRNQLGSLIAEGDILTTFSDNSKMWVYFNVPEAQYLEYVAELKLPQSKQVQHDSDREVKFVAGTDDDDDLDDDKDDKDDEQEMDDQGDDDKEDEDEAASDNDGPAQGTSGDKKSGSAAGFNRFRIELKLANGKTFPQPGSIGAIEADFNNTTGNIPFRADFSNPDGLLRNGQTGTILIHRTLDNAIVIPQRATYEILDKRYAYVVDKDGVVHQRDITVALAQDDIFIVSEGLEPSDRIVLEGIRQVRDGDKIEFEYRAPEKVLGSLKYHAE